MIPKNFPPSIIEQSIQMPKLNNLNMGNILKVEGKEEVKKEESEKSSSEESKEIQPFKVSFPKVKRRNNQYREI